MQLKTILNYVERHKGFVYGDAKLLKSGSRMAIEVPIRPRKNSLAICGGCRQRRAGYDRLPERRFEFVPLWGIMVFFVYRLRRVNCQQCGVTAEAVPWSDGKSHLALSYRWFLARWAKRLSWKETASIFQTSWDTVFRSVRYAVMWGIAHQQLDGIEAIGIDEVQWQRGHHYLTLVYQIQAGMKRLLWVAPERTEESLRGFLECLPDKTRLGIRYVCTDMWKPYMNVIVEMLSQSIHILDRFHIMSNMNKAIDEVRRSEASRMKRDGYEPLLKHSRWCLLKRAENLTVKQAVKLKELLRYNLQSVRAHLQREDFQRFWDYQQPQAAGRFLDQWCRRAMLSKIEPMKKMARSLREHHSLLLNWFRAKGTVSSGTVEGFNNKVKLTMRKSYGFRSYEAVELALYHNLGALPEPEFTHEFC